MEHKKPRRYREIYDPLDEIIGRYLGAEMRQPTEDDVIAAIDEKYKKIHLDVNYLRRQGLSKEQIMKELRIGEMAYLRAVDKLKSYGRWKIYAKKDTQHGHRDKAETLGDVRKADREPT